MARGRIHKSLFVFGLLCISFISFSQSPEFQTMVAEVTDEMLADGWEYMEGGYNDINDEWSIATEEHYFSAYTKYLAIVIVEGSPLYAPYIVLRDIDGVDHERENDKIDEGNFRLAMTGYHYSEVGYGSFVGKIHSPEEVKAYILLLTRDD